MTMPYINNVHLIFMFKNVVLHSFSYCEHNFHLSVVTVDPYEM
jgi:hypothetical protein